MDNKPKRAVKISIGTIIILIVLFMIYSIITCSKEKIPTEADKARLILDAIHISLKDYLDKNGKFPEYIEVKQTFNTFAPILDLDVPYISGSPFSRTDIILTSVSTFDGKYTVSIKLHNGKMIGINENGEIIE